MLFNGGMIWNRTMNVVLCSVSNSVYIFFFSSSILSSIPLDVSIELPELRFRRCFLIQFAFLRRRFNIIRCCCLFIRVEWCGYEREIECLSIWFYLYRASVVRSLSLSLFHLSSSVDVQRPLFCHFHSLVYANNKINNTTSIS